jgi:hypothetical protein
LKTELSAEVAKEDKLGIDHDLIALELEKAHLELSKLKDLEKQNEPFELMQQADIKDVREKRLQKEKFASSKAIHMVSAKNFFVYFNVLLASEKSSNS